MSKKYYFISIPFCIFIGRDRDASMHNSCLFAISRENIKFVTPSLLSVLHVREYLWAQIHENNWRIEVTETPSKTSPAFCVLWRVIYISCIHQSLVPFRRRYWWIERGARNEGMVCTRSIHLGLSPWQQPCITAHCSERTLYWMGNSTYNDIGTIFVLNFTLHLLKPHFKRPLKLKNY